MMVVGYRVGDIGDLRFESGLAAFEKTYSELTQATRVFGRAVFQNALAGLIGQVETGKIRITLFQLVDDPQRLKIMFEPPVFPGALVQCILARMAERGMTQIVRETDCFGQRLIEMQLARDRTRDLGHLERVSQPGAIHVAFMIDEHLGLVDQAPERGRVQHAVAIALEFAPIFVTGLAVSTASRRSIERGIRRETGIRQVHAAASRLWCRKRSSSSPANSDVSLARPISSSNTSRSCPAWTFLSRWSAAKKRWYCSGGGRVGSPAASSSASIRGTALAGRLPTRTENCAAIIMPAATASPCSQRPYPWTASMAWPKVCPRLSNARIPCSVSSRATMSALISQLRVIACSRASVSRRNSAGSASSSQAKKSRSRINPYLNTSASPARYSRSSSVTRAAVSAITQSGW